MLLVESVILVPQIPFQDTAALPKGTMIHEFEIICRESAIRDRLRLGAGPE